MPTESEQKELWTRGDGYEPSIGRWSRLVAREFLAWLRVRPNKRWLDVGSGTGALTQTILELGQPEAVVGIDLADRYVEYARAHVTDPRAAFRVGNAQDLQAARGAQPNERGGFDAVVSGLTLTLVPAPERMVREMARTCRLNGTVALYVWDESGEMQLMHYFWQAAGEVSGVGTEPDSAPTWGVEPPPAVPQARRLWNLFLDAGLNDVTTRAIDIPTVFSDFDDYWLPFLGGQGTASVYAMSLSEDTRAALRAALRARLPIAADGSIALTARAWAVRGTR